ncbi:cobalt-precorrin-2 C(20)-methyltransferase (plasmid) [Haloferax mediterranei ATCC 33500]|uniref:Cobalt-precorrin-2 C(20)-methyltransferase n=1 Tax=Haloferax mediterranei (strain ATCC 33500 / DSM 1411 / JCM 8866 / NBRC 14739 / NCIMB 2177 / R-4) TaxID=523841 RepID=I3R9I9_HALMT|nr:SAM-dependent methyltransferase [Haloferax mediterranei]AFK20899.1 precorrin-3B C17-methyltransferase [Haloferax mediterranei ATCC 33500]AHZ24232.1 uroporphyrin-III methyltransferase [Haloferax mediterranei ATCC 33500]EMA05311.1 precorrin-3B C(17)-methyltransferase [Haloferax mediterranei ATCC 33500]MDX5989887.1 SAM-dependent methyltransferase [Haloferax mediterranei ATCC 33500]QCQ77328.1 cobalt-precorrin-2 C(20)-methyltransferase [Haloferax mediterranei ATCC 33500]
MSEGAATTTGDREEAPDDYGTLYVVGIGPGLPAHMTQRAKEVIQTADCVVASNLYQEFLRDDDTLPPEDSDEGPEVVRSSMGQQVELTREAFERVREGEDVAHVSGGDPNVYGKSDLVFTMADADDATDVPIEIVPGVTAALGGAAMMGAPLSNDFCTISLSDKWRGWDEIEEKLRAAAISNFVIVLYNCWRNYTRAIDIVREERADDVPVGIFNDAGRGESGRNLDDETFSITTLGDAKSHDEDVGGMGTSILIGTHETEPWSNDYETYLVTPRGGRDVDDF